jgi:hypothetical protein
MAARLADVYFSQVIARKRAHYWRALAGDSDTSNKHHDI